MKTQYPSTFCRIKEKAVIFVHFLLFCGFVSFSIFKITERERRSAWKKGIPNRERFEFQNVEHANMNMVLRKTMENENETQ